jgi:hypothetical protein
MKVKMPAWRPLCRRAAAGELREPALPPSEPIRRSARFDRCTLTAVYAGRDAEGGDATGGSGAAFW